jgi:hypothetical protein
VRSRRSKIEMRTEIERREEVVEETAEGTEGVR